jgi:hypothetical protein
VCVSGNRAVQMRWSLAIPACRRIVGTHIFDHSCPSLHPVLVLLHRQSLSREVSGKAMCDLAGRSVGWGGGQMWRVAVRGGRVCASVYGERC